VPDHKVRRALSLSAAALLGVSALALMPLAAQGTTTTVPPANTVFKLTGAVNGTLTLRPLKCQGAAKEFSFPGETLGSQQSNWSVFVTTPTSKSGTWKKFGQSPSAQNNLGVQIQTQSTSGATEWFTKSGRITTHNGAGNVNVVLGFEGSYTGPPSIPYVHMVGQWSCLKSK